MKSRKQKKVRRSRSQRGGGTLLKVHFGNRPVQSNNIPLANTQGIPSVTIQSGPTALYTLIMHDPDAPGHDKEHPWLHWLVTNIPGPNFNEGNVVFSYEAPQPPSGIHRYYFSLYEQAHGRINVAPVGADQFNLKEFLRSNGLRLVGQVYMRVSKNITT